LTESAIEPARLLRQKLLPATAEDRYFDYCLEPYEPRRPWQGKLRGENLLWYALELASCRAELEPPLRALQSSLGSDLTVWGVKWDGDELFFEIYLYDPQKEDPAATVAGFSATLAPWLTVEPRPSETIPYKMVSFDLSKRIAAARSIAELNLYLTGEAVHAGRSYALSRAGAELRNTYRFFPAKLESDAVVELVKSSQFVDYSPRGKLAKVISPELFACKKICVSKKRVADAIYFSGVAVDQLRWFLRRFDYPARLQELVRAHEAAFEHLYFDVGIDYLDDPTTGALRYPKTSFYGTL
jgi:hypothetical protein